MSYCALTVATAVAVAGISYYVWNMLFREDGEDYVTALCTRRFLSLKPYFKNVLISDLKDCAEYEIWMLSPISKCGLHDEDMDDVADLLMKMPSCNMVNLSWNRSYGVASSLKKMLDGAITRILRLPHIEFLDITYNPFASIDRTEFFQNPALCDDTKLVWVPSVFLEEKNKGTPTWHYIITNMDRQKILLETHRKYDKTEWK